jgi:hypothetical protein
LRTSLIILVTMLLTPPAAWAGTLEGVTMPDTIVVADTTLHLNGMGLRKRLGAKIYVAALYLEEKTDRADKALNGSGPSRIVMHYLTDKATDKRIDAAWIKGFRTNSPQTYEILEHRVNAFVATLGDMKAGDVVEFTMIPGETTIITLNGEEIGAIGGDDFQLAILRVGLGSKPPSKALKAGLLGTR